MVDTMIKVSINQQNRLFVFICLNTLLTVLIVSYCLDYDITARVIYNHFDMLFPFTTGVWLTTTHWTSMSLKSFEKKLEVTDYLSFGMYLIIIPVVALLMGYDGSKIGKCSVLAISNIMMFLFGSKITLK